MARKSRKVDYVNIGNKENLVTEAENQCEKVSHAALYARLSYESEKNRERNTIETQMVLLHNFVKEQKDILNTYAGREVPVEILIRVAEDFYMLEEITK